MVHALREIHGVLEPGGILVDARPDTRVVAYAERRKPRGFQRYGVVKTKSSELANALASDRSVATAVAEGLFKRRRRGRFYHRIPFANLAQLRQYLAEHPSFDHQPDWTVDAPSRRQHASDQFVIRRPVRYELLEARHR